MARLTLFLLIALVNAAPIPQRRDTSSVVSWLCQQPVVAQVCSKVGSIVGSASGTKLVSTPRGPVYAALLANAIRATVPYAKPPTGQLRFADPVKTSWSSPIDGSKTPSPCPQSADIQSTNEDCLYVSALDGLTCSYFNVFAPKSATGASKLPVFVWTHGGSNIIGSSTAPGLDGSTLAAGQNIVVVTLQYRLGSLGFSLFTGTSGNQAVKDLIFALSVIKSDIASFGGDPSAVTLAGQSSGASLLATLLATPSADSLFQRAIIQSAPLFAGDQSTQTASAIGSLFLQALNCTTLACAQSASVSSILNAQSQVFSAAPQQIPAVAASLPIRPYVDGSLIKGNLIPLAQGLNGGFSNKGRAIIFSTVRDEAAPTIDAIAGGQPLPPDAFNPIIDELLPPQSRATAVENSNLYTSTGTSQYAVNDALTILGTDYVWRCAAEQIAVNATLSKSATVFLTEVEQGVNYVDTAPIAYCNGRVCHEGDVYQTFGNSPSPNSAQAAAQAEHVARWTGFVKTGSPNANGLPTWSPVGSGTQLNLLQLGAPSSFIQAFSPACGSLWGKGAVPFDEQIFGP